MTKFNVKNLIIVVFLGVFLFGIMGIVNAQEAETLPKGGDSFETAVELKPGKYQGGTTVKGQELYYYVQGKPGQQLKSKIKMEGAGWDMHIFNESEKEIAFGYGTDFQIDWLANADKSSYKYYIEISSKWNVDSFSLEVSLDNYYDIGSQTDAGDNFGKALNITSGDYDGYLAGGAGDDHKDYYKIPLKKGTVYEFRLIPPTEKQMYLGIFDLNRTLIKEKASANIGAVVALSLTPAAATDVFLVVRYPDYYYATGSEVQKYKLNIKSSGSLLKFYNCDGANCQLAGEFSSLEDCQKTTSKICYRIADCDGKCGQKLAPTPKALSGQTSQSSIVKQDLYKKLSISKNINWFLIGGLIIVLVILIIFVIILLKKNKRT